MLPESQKLVSDMLDSARTIGEFSTGKSLTDFARDKLLRAGIYYQFVVIGEALTQLRNRDPQAVAAISEHARIIGFRNQIIHGYAKIDDEITWRIVESKIPILIKELETLLAG